MAIYYVATNGNNGATGGIGAPWKTISHGMNQLNPGDTLRINSGSYHEAIDVVLTGTASNRIVVEATNPGNKPILDGRAPLDRQDANQKGVAYNSGLPNGKTYKQNLNSWSKTYQFVAINPALLKFSNSGTKYSKHFTIKNLKILHSKGRSLNFEAPAPSYGSIENISANNFHSKDVEFDGVEFDWSRLQAISMKNVGDARFKNCIFAHSASFFQTPNRCKCYQCKSCSDQYPLQSHNACVSFGGTKDVLVEDCELYEAWGEGIIFSSNSVQSDGIIVRRFVGYDCVKSPLYIHACTNATVEQSLIYRSKENQVYPSDSWQWNGKDNPAFKTNGISIQSSEGDKTWSISTHDVMIRNNIVVNCTFGIRVGGSLNTEQIKNVKILGNTVINPDSNCLTLLGRDPRNFEVKNNLFYKTNGGVIAEIQAGRYDSSLVVNNNGWSSQPPARLQGNNDVVGNLGLANPEAKINFGSTNIANYRLKSSSACRGAGVALGTLTTDYEGNTRTSPPDIGALQFDSDGPPPPATSTVTAVIDAIASSGDTPFNPVFDASNSTAENTSISQYIWTFGDGTTGSGVTPNKTYNQIGVYNVTLEVRGASGATDTTSIQVTVTGGDDPVDPTNDAEANVGTILSSTIVQQTLEAHGLDVTPALVLLFPADVGTSPIIYDDYSMGIGAVASNGSVCVASRSLADVSKSNSATIIRENYGIVLTGANGVESVMAKIGMDQTNLIIDWEKVTGETQQFGYMAIGGTSARGSVHVANPGDTIDLGYDADVLIFLGGGVGVSGAIGTVRQMMGFTDDNGMVNVSNFEKTSQVFTSMFGYASEQHSGSYRGGYSHINLNKSGRFVTVEDVGDHPWNDVVAFAAIKFGGNAYSISLELTPPDSNPKEYDLTEELGFALGFISNVSTKEEQVDSGNVGSLGIFAFDGSGVYSLNSWGKASLDLASTPAIEQTNVDTGFVVMSEDTDTNSGRFLYSELFANGTNLRFEQQEAPAGAQRYMALLMVQKSKDATEVPEPVVVYTPESPTINDTITFEVLNGPSFDFSLDPGDGSPIKTGARTYQHQYSTPDTYTVSVSLSDPGPPAQSAFGSITVVVTDQGLIPAFTASLYSGGEPEEITLDASDSDGGLSTLEYKWRIIEDDELEPGDTEIFDDLDFFEYTGVQVNHIFTRGDWAIQLTITDVDDPSRTAHLLKRSLISITSPGPRGDFNIDTTSGSSPLKVTFTPMNELYGQEILEEKWIVNGLTYPGYQTEFVFTEPGVHEITYYVRTQSGFDEVTKTVTVTASEVYPIGYAVPDDISKASQSTVYAVPGESYHAHTHRIDGTETGESSKVVFTNFSGGTQLKSLGINVNDPGDDTVIWSEPGKQKRLDVRGWIATNEGLGTRYQDQDLGLFAHANIVTEPRAGAIVPNEPHTQSIGSYSYPYSTMYIDEVIANILVARNILTTIGGHLVVAPTSKLKQEIESDDFVDLGGGPQWKFRIDKTFPVQVGDYLLMRGNTNVGTQQVEVLEVVTILTSQYDGEYLLDCYRGVDGTPLNTWPENSAVVNVRKQGRPFGLIDLYSEEAYFDAGKGPAIVFRARDSQYPASSQPWYDLTIQAAFGNLGGRYGFNADTYGIGIGQDRPDAAYFLAIKNALGFYGENRELLVEMTADNGLQMYTGTISDWKRDLSFVRKVGSTTQNLVRYGGFYDTPTGSVQGKVSASGHDAVSNATMEVKADVPTSENKTATLRLHAVGDNDSPDLTFIAGPSSGWVTLQLPTGQGTGSEDPPTGAPNYALYRNSSGQVKLKLP